MLFLLLMKKERNVPGWHKPHHYTFPVLSLHIFSAHLFWISDSRFFKDQGPWPYLNVLAKKLRQTIFFELNLEITLCCQGIQEYALVV